MINWKKKEYKQLVSVILETNDREMLQNFLRDLMTEKEIEEAAMRFEAAIELAKGDTYMQVQKNTNLSSRTVARVSVWLKKGLGYKNAIKILSHHSSLSKD